MLEVGILKGLVYVCLTALGATLVLSFARLVLGPSLPDRIVALDLIAYQAVAVMLVLAVAVDQPNFLEAALVLALIAFLGTIAFARYLERQAVP